MTRADTILASVRRIHDASLTADVWQPALQSVISLLNGDHAILLANDHARPDGALASSFGLDQGGFARFASPEAAGWLEPALRAARSGSAVTRSRLISDRQFERSDFYNEIVRPVGGFHALCVVHQMPTLSSFFAVCRSRRSGDFDADDLAMMQTLSPHVGTALRVRQRLGAADLTAQSPWVALDRLSTGAIVVDGATAVVFANKAAEIMFAARKLRLDRDGICIGDECAGQTMRRMIRACTNGAASRFGEGGTVELSQSGPLAGIRITVTPFQSDRVGFEPGGDLGPLALLLVSEPQQDRRRKAEALQRRFALTPAEAAFALEIIKGDGRAAAAARLNISVGTARTHLERIFQKTGVRRQAALVRLLAESGCAPE
jgi:DNA-binding CsgD family transcriptional regulator